MADFKIWVYEGVAGELVGYPRSAGRGGCVHLVYKHPSRTPEQSAIEDHRAICEVQRRGFTAEQAAACLTGKVAW